MYATSQRFKLKFEFAGKIHYLRSDMKFQGNLLCLVFAAVFALQFTYDFEIFLTKLEIFNK